jgi:hypothetical protein
METTIMMDLLLGWGGGVDEGDVGRVLFVARSSEPSTRWVEPFERFTSFRRWITAEEVL